MDWIGKSAVVDHHARVPFRFLKPVRTLSTQGTSENMLIEGDNLEALKSLMPYYRGKINCVYIDPPYNTGNEGWAYNDNVNSPQIRHWLNKTVGPESEDYARHDKWLCMMYPRLRLLKDLLSDDGVIFVSIDDNEVHNLIMIMNEIFGSNEFVCNIIWQSKVGAADAKTIETTTEYILVYTKKKNCAKFSRNTMAHDINRYKLEDEHIDERGPYYTDTLDRGGLRYSDSLNYAITSPDGTPVYPNGRTKFENDGWTWKWSKDKVEWGVKQGFIVFRKASTKKSGWKVLYKIYLYVDNNGQKRQRSAPFKNLITDIKTGHAATDIKKIFGNSVMKYTKPVQLLSALLSMIQLPPDGIILDSFAGSGTTGHALLHLNKLNNKNRRFILIEMDKNISRNITLTRINYALKEVSGGGGLL